jgi:hypothetical protein
MEVTVVSPAKDGGTVTMISAFWNPEALIPTVTSLARSPVNQMGKRHSLGHEGAVQAPRADYILPSQPGTEGGESTDVTYTTGMAPSIRPQWLLMILLVVMIGLLTV